MADGIIWQDKELVANIQDLSPRIQNAIAATMAYHEPRAIAYARQNAPWTDRTTNARNGLGAKARVDHGRKRYSLTVFHSVPYGIWLEVRFAGRFSIIRPTIEHQGPLVMATARALVGRALRA